MEVLVLCAQVVLALFLFAALAVALEYVFGVLFDSFY